MIIAIEERRADLVVDFEAQWKISLDPGIWVIESRGETVSVTTIYGRWVAGHLHVSYPRGVTRRMSGPWSIQERILVDVLPGDPKKDWLAIPEALRSALEDAYLLARHDLPDQLGVS